jgi:hypothetical protein
MIKLSSPIKGFYHFLGQLFGFGKGKTTHVIMDELE